MIRLGIQNCLRFGPRYVNKTQMQVETARLKTIPVFTELIRTATFFNKVSAEKIIKSVTTVSNPGKRRGRGRTMGRKVFSDLNKGQIIGVGKENMKWPGLNSRIIQGPDVLQLEKLPPDPDYEKNLIAMRNQGTRKRLMKVHPMERGWTSKSICGKSLGPPPTSGHGNFEDFDSVVLEIKHLNIKRGKLGSVRSVSAYVVAGNKNGLLGIGCCKSPEMKLAVQKAQRKAITRLIHYKFEEKHAINHDFYYNLGRVKIFVYKKPEGYGLVCHRALAVCCKLLGISDIYAKREGSRNLQHTVKAFLLGLLKQKTYQEIADEKKLHLVELRKERMYFPNVLASPAEVEKNNQNETFIEYIMDGGVPLRKSKPPMEKSLNYERHVKKVNYRRNHDQLRLKLHAEYGECRSYLADIYPECKAFIGSPKEVEQDTSG